MGVLQFDVIKFRLLNEYGVQGIFESISYTCARWYHSDNPAELKAFETRYADQIALDIKDKRIFLANSSWDLDYAQKKFKNLQLFQNSDHIPLNT